MPGAFAPLTPKGRGQITNRRKMKGTSKSSILGQSRASSRLKARLKSGKEAAFHGNMESL